MRYHTKKQHLHPNSYFLLPHTIDRPDSAANGRPPWIFDPLSGDDSVQKLTALVSTSDVEDVQRKGWNGVTDCIKTTHGFFTEIGTGTFVSAMITKTTVGPHRLS